MRPRVEAGRVSSFISYYKDLRRWRRARESPREAPPPRQRRRCRGLTPDHPRTTTTGIVLWVSTRCVSLPSITSDRPRLPCEAIDRIGADLGRGAQDRFPGERRRSGARSRKPRLQLPPALPPAAGSHALPRSRGPRSRRARRARARCLRRQWASDTRRGIERRQPCPEGMREAMACSGLPGKRGTVGGHQHMLVHERLRSVGGTMPF